MKNQRTTSWESSSQWYDDAVGEQGHYYHRTLILPNVVKLLHLKNSSDDSVLDLACGQGVLSRQIPKEVEFVGIDISPRLISAAKQYGKNPKHQFFVGDATAPLPVEKRLFNHGTIILALQNIEFPEKVFMNFSKHLKLGAPLIIILNHPCFRIPRQSSWKVDPVQKIQYRRIDRYMSEMKIPIQTHPGKQMDSDETWSFHHPLSSYTQWLSAAGFAIDQIQEWCSNKVSEGGAAKMENRSRQEIPLFMAIVAKKIR